jgi:2-hydroxychromene-2-carboxylate isomerase
VSFTLANAPGDTAAPVTFYFDLGSPYAYLACERLSAVMPEPVRWQPVLLGGLFKLNGRSSWALGDHRRRAAGMAEIERRAHASPPSRSQPGAGGSSRRGPFAMPSSAGIS